MDFIVQTDDWVKIKEIERETNIAVEHENDGDTSSNWCAWNGQRDCCKWRSLRCRMATMATISLSSTLAITQQRLPHYYNLAVPHISHYATKTPWLLQSRCPAHYPLHNEDSHITTISLPSTLPITQRRLPHYYNLVLSSTLAHYATKNSLITTISLFNTLAITQRRLPHYYNLAVQHRDCSNEGVFVA